MFVSDTRSLPTDHTQHSDLNITVSNSRSKMALNCTTLMIYIVESCVRIVRRDF